MRSSVWCREVDDDDNEVVMVPPCSVCLVCVFLHIVYNTPQKRLARKGMPTFYFLWERDLRVWGLRVEQSATNKQTLLECEFSP